MAVTVRRLSEMFLGKVQAAIEANAAGDDLGWEMGIAPTMEQGLVNTVVIEMASPIIGAVPLRAMISFGKGMATTDDEIANVITNTLEELRKARSQMLQEGAALDRG